MEKLISLATKSK